MALGCAFIFLLVLTLCRRRMRKRRAKHIDACAEAKRLDQKSWRRWLGEKLFGHCASPPPSMGESQAMKMRAAEEARAHLDDIIGAREYSREGPTRWSRSSNTPSVLPSFADERNTKRDPHDVAYGSMYSVVTGKRRSAPEPRQPVNKNKNLLLPFDPVYCHSCHSSVTHVDYNPDSKAPLGVDVPPTVPVAPLVDVEDPSDAEAYARFISGKGLEGSFRLSP